MVYGGEKWNCSLISRSIWKPMQLPLIGSLLDTTAISNWWHIYFSQNALMPVNHPFVDCWEENLIFTLLINKNWSRHWGTLSFPSSHFHFCFILTSDNLRIDGLQQSLQNKLTKLLHSLYCWLPISQSNLFLKLFNENRQNISLMLLFYLEHYLFVISFQ